MFAINQYVTHNSWRIHILYQFNISKPKLLDVLRFTKHRYKHIILLGARLLPRTTVETINFTLFLKIISL